MRIKYIVNKNSRFAEFNKLISSKFPQIITEKSPEILLVAGGDGAMLRAIHLNRHLNLPFFGKALGTLNFLLNDIDDDEKILQKIISDEITLDYQSGRSIEVAVKTGHEKYAVVGHAINDVVFGNNLMGYHEFILNSKDGSFNNFLLKGTGICVSTTLGSTAYNFNNGGVILPLDTDLWSITGIACNRYLKDVLPAQEIEIGLKKIKGKVKIFLDGLDPEVTISADTLIRLRYGQEIKLGFLNKEIFCQKRTDLGHRLRK